MIGTDGWGKKTIFSMQRSFSPLHRLFKPNVKRSRGDVSGSRLNTHSGKRIVSQFGQLEPETEYPSKRVAVRGQREINESEVVANNTWVSFNLNSRVKSAY
jgi:hypothetical protein